MNPLFTRPFRASIVARARFIEDLVVEQASRGLSQYVILGAGLDSFAQRRQEIACRLRVFEIDRPGPQAWKRQRLIAPDQVSAITPCWPAQSDTSHVHGKAECCQFQAFNCGEIRKDRLSEIVNSKALPDRQRRRPNTVGTLPCGGFSNRAYPADTKGSAL
jgi:hypothetical protein